MPLTRYPGVGARIKSRMKALGYWKRGKPDIPRFSKELSYDFRYVYLWTSDKMNPGPTNLRRLASDLGTSVTWLLHGEEAPPAEPPSRRFVERIRALEQHGAAAVQEMQRALGRLAQVRMKLERELQRVRARS